jgi:hypothetical protein
MATKEIGEIAKDIESQFVDGSRPIWLDFRQSMVYTVQSIKDDTQSLIKAWKLALKQKLRNDRSFSKVRLSLFLINSKTSFVDIN